MISALVLIVQLYMTKPATPPALHVEQAPQSVATYQWHA